MSDAPVPVLLTVGEIAQRLGVPLHRVEYLIRSRRIVPASRAGNVRVFAEDDVLRLAKELAQSRPPTKENA